MRCIEVQGERHFQVRTSGGRVETRAVLLATGVTDLLPEIDGLRAFYGRSVHHCPYCDGWEHRGKRIATIGNKAVELAITLLSWSSYVTACTNGVELTASDRKMVAENPIAHRAERILQVRSDGETLKSLEFSSAEPLICDAIFFSADQTQHSSLPAMLGCMFDDDSHVKTAESCATNVDGVYLAGDASGSVQFAIAAAAEGAIAAVAIDKWLRKRDRSL